VYFIKYKKIHSESERKCSQESDRCPEAAAGQNQRTVSCLQDRLRTGGLKQEILLLPIFYNSVYNLNLQPQDTTTDYRGKLAYHYYNDYPGRYAYHYYYYYCLYRGRLRLQSQELQEVSFQEFIILYKEYQLPPTPSS
jgi:hypothetical protein